MGRLGWPGKGRPEAARLMEQGHELQERARLEDLTVREEALIKQTKKGEKIYYR